jgi:cytochrome P450
MAADNLDHTIADRRPGAYASAPKIPDAEDLNSVESVSAWFGRFYEGDCPDALERFERLRAQGPVVFSDGLDFGEFRVPDLWNQVDCRYGLALSYNAVATLLQSPDAFSKGFYPVSFGPNSPYTREGVEHLQFRRMVIPALNPKTIRTWGDIARDAAERLADELAAGDTAELVTQFSRRLPGRVFGPFIDAGSDDADHLTAWAIRQMYAHDEQGQLAVKHVTDYMGRHIEERRSLSAEVLAERRDLISVLMSASLEGRSLTDEEINTALHNALTGGVDSSAKGLASTLFFLLTKPGLRDAIKANPKTLSAAIEESVRLASPNVFGAARMALADTVLDGVEVPKGTVMIINLPMANRDPSRWENPGDFDLERPTQPHIGWGSGPHVCLGMNLARLIISTGIEVLLQRWPEICVDDNYPPPKLTGLGTLTPHALHVLLRAG